MLYLSPFLKICLIIACFSESGKIPEEMELLISVIRGAAIALGWFYSIYAKLYLQFPFPWLGTET